MRDIRIKRITALVMILLCLCISMDCRVFGKVDPSVLTSLDRLPGVKTFDFAADPIRENISAASMVGPEYSIKLTKEFPDEYFGIPTSTLRDPSSGNLITGVYVHRDGGNAAKGACGCIYRNLFQYKGRWIDVKTTYMDWYCQVKSVAFMCGGFANYRWQSLWYLEMKHEFFLAGTNTPVEVKGYLEYADVDNSQGIMLRPGEYDGIWVNGNGTIIGYRNIPAHVDIVHEKSYKNQIENDMFCIQAMTNDDYPSEGESGYNRQDAARTTFAYTFSGSVLHTALIDDDTTGVNIMNNSSKKHVPSAIPGDNSPDVVKSVSDEDETDVVSNHVRNWQQWTYRVKAIVPLETEPGNLYDGFAIRDDIDPALEILEVSIKREDEDVTDLFDISTDSNQLIATAEDCSDASFYGYTYILEITVKTGATKEELKAQNLLDEDNRIVYSNVAQVIYEDGNGQNEVETNSTDTTVQYEREGDIAITKKLRAEDIYAEHGDTVFIFRLTGTSVSGEEKEYNRAVRMDDATKTVWFRNIPEGTYTCSEYETFRFLPDSITDVTGGTVSGDSVSFQVDGITACRATFSNIRKSWENYSDSSLAVNRLGLGNN